jgi:hypothetical protein
MIKGALIIITAVIYYDYIDLIHALFRLETWCGSDAGGVFTHRPSASRNKPPESGLLLHNLNLTGGAVGPLRRLIVAECRLKIMNTLLLIIILLLLFGGGGFYIGGPAIGGGGLGLVLLICLIIFLMGGFGPRD